MIRIFIGFDPRETLAYHVLSQSILEQASEPVAITPVALSTLHKIFDRQKDPRQSTDFSFSRFLTPYLSDFSGWSIFMDCDMLLLDDIARLWALRDDRYAVQVVKHNHVPQESTKFLGMPQTRYDKKNWSSVMLFNNARCTRLTPDYVNHASGLELHQFKWLSGDHLIGALPDRWNHLVGVQAHCDDVSLVHYTIGGPYFEEWKRCDYSEAWLDACTRMVRVDQQADNNECGAA